MEAFEHHTDIETSFAQICGVKYISSFRNAPLDFILVNRLISCDTRQAFLQVSEQISSPYFVTDPLASCCRYISANTEVSHHLPISFVNVLVLSSQHVQLLGCQDILFVRSFTHE